MHLAEDLVPPSLVVTLPLLPPASSSGPALAITTALVESILGLQMQYYEQLQLLRVVPARQPEASQNGLSTPSRPLIEIQSSPVLNAPESSPVTAPPLSLIVPVATREYIAAALAAAKLKGKRLII
jgi:hypothetical protein